MAREDFGPASTHPRMRGILSAACICLFLLLPVAGGAVASGLWPTAGNPGFRVLAWSIQFQPGCWEACLIQSRTSGASASSMVRILT